MNTTANGSSCPSPFNTETAKIGRNFLYSLVFVVSLLGNSFIGITVYKTQTLRKPINFFIVNMATSDLLYSLFLFPMNFTNLPSHSWLISGSLGQALCKLVPFLVNVFLVVSFQSMILIAVDRFGAVVFPLRSPLISSKMCPFFILATWISSIAAFSPYLFASKVVENPGGLQCVQRWKEAIGESFYVKKYNLALFVVFFCISLAIVTILYSIIVIKLKSQQIPGEQSAIAQQQRANRNRNVLKMASAIVLGFILCWVPYSFGRFLYSFVGPKSLPCGFFIYITITRFIAFSNCAINPCICFTFSSNYRSGLKRLLRCFSGAQQKQKE